MKQLRIDIYENGRYKGQLKLKDRWMGIMPVMPVDIDEVKEEIEQRLPTLRKTNYTIAFA